MIEKRIITEGCKLFVFSLAYIFLSSMFFNTFYASTFAMYLGIFLGIGYLFLWFYHGYKLKIGFKKGLFVGALGATGGIILAVLSLLMLLASDGAGLWVMAPWSFPFLSIFNLIPHLGPINHYLPHISVVLVILLTAIGSKMGQNVSIARKLENNIIYGEPGNDSLRP